MCPNKKNYGEGKMQKYFQVLGVPATATDEEIKNAYDTLKEKYSKERFLEGEAGNVAARELTKLETAYLEIINYRKQNKIDGEKVKSYLEVENLIRAGDIAGAQTALDNMDDRGAEWHYLQSVVFYKKNWLNESRKQLEIALNMEPHNPKYADDYAKLKEKMEYNNRQFNNGYYGANYAQQESRQMGGTDSNGCVDWCLTMCFMNLLCNMCCR